VIEEPRESKDPEGDGIKKCKICHVFSIARLICASQAAT